jgi:hypothetical protein
MNEPKEANCPECQDPVDALPTLDRRNFIRVIGGSVAAFAAGAPVLRAADATPDKPAKPAESLIQELFGSLDDEQKKNIVMPFDHGGTTPTRLGMYNGPVLNKKIGSNYTKAQQELIQKIVRSMAAGEDGYQRLSRNGTWDGSHALENCGCAFFGQPKDNEKYAWVFSGHHLTIRADGDFMDGAAWGGPMYYGHSPNGYSDKNIFYFQTKSVLEVMDALDEKQKAKAIVAGSPGEQAPSVKFRKAEEVKPGIAARELSADQRKLVEQVMRNLLAPYRKEDADEVMEILKKNGGLEKLHLAFYRDKGAAENERWHFWRLEGPGFVWNYRVLPHVHCYVNIATA